MRAPANNHCTYDGSAYAQFDCAALADPLRMALLVAGPYRNSTVWGDALLVVETTAPGPSVAATPIVVSPAKFFFERAETESPVLAATPTRGVVAVGTVTAVECTSCGAGSVFFVGGASVGVGETLARQVISATHDRYMAAPATDGARTRTGSSSLTARSSLTRRR